MARLTPEKREDIKNALLLGDSQYKVAQDFEVSPATVNKIFKEIDKNLLIQTERIVNDEVAIKSILSEQSERFVKAFDDKVNDEIRRKNLVFNATEKLLKKIDYAMDNHKPLEKVNCGDGVQQLIPVEYSANDYKNFADAIDKASVTLGVNQRHSNSQVTVNTQNNNIAQIELNKEIVSKTLESFEDEY